MAYIKEYNLNRKLIKEGNIILNQRNINIDHIPYTLRWQYHVIYTMIDINKLHNNLPNEIIKYIGYIYFNINKIVNIALNNIQYDLISPCSEKNCLLYWFSFFNTSFSPLLYMVEKRIHCNSLNCHFIGKINDFNICNNPICGQYYCQKCKDGNYHVCKNK